VTTQNKDTRQTNATRRDDLNKVKNKLKEMLKNMKNNIHWIECECSCSKGQQAYVWPWGNVVHVCPDAFTLGTAWLESTLVHEYSHVYLDTKDIAYKGDPSYSGLSSEDKTNNADNWGDFDSKY